VDLARPLAGARAPHTHHSSPRPREPECGAPVYPDLAGRVDPEQDGGSWQPTAERLGRAAIRTIKEEEIALAEYRGFAEALAQIEPFIDAGDRTKRVHAALGDLTPVAFETA
jgi:hypothetical protein